MPGKCLHYLSLEDIYFFQSLENKKLFSKELIFPFSLSCNYSHSADWCIVFFLNEYIFVLSLLCPLMMKDNINLVATA